jgi:hypothetical protein
MSKKRTIAGSKPRKASKSKKKKITITEKRFAQLIHGGMPIAEAARRVWGWRCEPWSKEYARAKYLAYSPRVREFINQLEQDEIKQSQADFIAARASHVTLEDMRQYCYDRLIELRNNDEAGSRQRLMAIELLEKLADPAKDINLIWRWIDVLWRNYTAHCPCCHKDFPLWEVQNPRIEAYRKDSKLPATVHETDEVQRKLNLIAIGEKRKQPHHAQMKILSALERHVVGTGAARAGKSLVMAWMAVIGFLIPGAESWLIARIYDDARSEMEYVMNFLRTMFHPVYDYMVHENIDKKTGEMTLISRWGSELTQAENWNTA